MADEGEKGRAAGGGEGEEGWRRQQRRSAPEQPLPLLLLPAGHKVLAPPGPLGASGCGALGPSWVGVRNWGSRFMSSIVAKREGEEGGGHLAKGHQAPRGSLWKERWEEMQLRGAALGWGLGLYAAARGCRL